MSGLQSPIPTCPTPTQREGETRTKTRTPTPTPNTARYYLPMPNTSEHTHQHHLVLEMKIAREMCLKYSGWEENCLLGAFLHLLMRFSCPCSWTCAFDFSLLCCASVLYAPQSLSAPTSRYSMYAAHLSIPLIESNIMYSRLLLHNVETSGARMLVEYPLVFSTTHIRRPSIRTSTYDPNQQYHHSDPFLTPQVPPASFPPFRPVPTTFATAANRLSRGGRLHSSSFVMKSPLRQDWSSPTTINLDLFPPLSLRQD